MNLSEKIETYLGRAVDFLSEVKLVSKNILDEEGNLIDLEVYIEEWNVEGVTKPTEAELDKIKVYINPRAAEEARKERDMLIAETDWTQILDVKLSDDKKEAYSIYRQALRDISEQGGFPQKVIFPVFEEILENVRSRK